MLAIMIFRAASSYICRNVSSYEIPKCMQLWMDEMLSLTSKLEDGGAYWALSILLPWRDTRRSTGRLEPKWFHHSVLRHAALIHIIKPLRMT